MIIKSQDKKEIISIAKKTLNQPLKLWAYGSRVDGEAHDGSDLDLVLISKDGEKVEISEFIDFKRLFPPKIPINPYK